MAIQNNGETFLKRKLQEYPADTLGVKEFAKIALSHTVSEINAFSKKFEMVAKTAGEQYLGKVARWLCR